MKMADRIGRQKAHELLKHLSNESNFIEAVKNNSTIMQYFSESDIDTILDPSNYIGLSSSVVENMVNKMNLDA